MITSRSGINPTRLENLLKEIELRGLHVTEEQAIIFLKENSKFHTNQLVSIPHYLEYTYIHVYATFKLKSEINI